VTFEELTVKNRGIKKNSKDVEIKANKIFTPCKKTDLENFPGLKNQKLKGKSGKRPTPVSLKRVEKRKRKIEIKRYLRSSFLTK